MSIVNQLRSFFSGRECISLALALMIYGDFIMKLLTNADAEHLNRNALFMWLEGEDKKCCRKFRAKWFPIKKIRSAEIYVGSARPPFETFCPNAFFIFFTLSSFTLFLSDLLYALRLSDHKSILLLT